LNKTDELITFWSHLKPTEIAFADESHEITFAELDKYTRKIGYMLKEKGIKRGEIVGLILPGHPGWLFYLALARLGVPTMMQNNLESFVPELIPDWLISLEAHPGKDSERTIIINEDYLKNVEISKELQDFEGFTQPADLATFYSTSGTNGETKFREISAEFAWTASLRMHTNNAFGEDDSFLLLPFGAAWTNRHISTCLIFGKTFYNCMFPDFRLLKFVSKYPIRTIMGSPVQISSFLEVQKQTNTNLPLLKTIIMSGSAPSDQLAVRIKSQLDCKIINAYGSTEVGFVAFSILEENQPAGAWVNPAVELEIVDDNDNSLPVMSVGHIRYRREDLETSYYKNPEATAQFFKDGYFYPGDLGFIDELGRLILEGRSTDVINLGGVVINPDRIESIAHAQLGVIDCAAFGQMNSSGIEVLCIALVVDADFIKEKFITSMFAQSPERISHVQIVPAIPRTVTGKIQRNLLVPVLEE
jgi:acyl-coenzyme A synthetase/AMP-(fatty) acid ligase